MRETLLGLVDEMRCGKTSPVGPNFVEEMKESRDPEREGGRLADPRERAVEKEQVCVQVRGPGGGHTKAPWVPRDGPGS